MSLGKWHLFFFLVSQRNYSMIHSVLSDLEKRNIRQILIATGKLFLRKDNLNLSQTVWTPTFGHPGSGRTYYE